MLSLLPNLSYKPELKIKVIEKIINQIHPNFTVDKLIIEGLKILALVRKEDFQNNSHQLHAIRVQSLWKRISCMKDVNNPQEEFQW